MSLHEYFPKIIRFLKKAEIKYDKVYFFKMDLKKMNFELKDDVVQVKIAKSVEDIKPVIRERGEKWQKRYSKWLKRGYVCYIGIVNNTVAGLVWMNNSDKVELVLGYKEKIKKGEVEAWLIDGYILKHFRGQRIYHHLWNGAMENIEQRGIRIVYGIIQNYNIRSFRVHYTLGLNTNVYKVLYYFKVLWFNIYIFKHYPRYRDIADLKKKLRFN